MTKEPHILLLAGSTQARQTAEALQAQGLSYAAWMSEAPRGSGQMPQAPQLRRFDSAAQMQAAMVQGGFDAVLDAGHVFDAATTAQAFAAARALGLPHLRLARPAWDLPQAERVHDVTAASALIPPGARVFSATGWDSLPAFAGFAGEVLLLRQTRRHGRAAPWPFVELVFGDPPFSVRAERALFEALRVDTLVCRNIGGEASMPKIEAAQALALRLIVIERPAPPSGMRVVTDMTAALDWMAGL
jgi:precorrin-6A/cobalt-precorrin-6A reductase